MLDRVIPNQVVNKVQTICSKINSHTQFTEINSKGNHKNFNYQL